MPKIPTFQATRLIPGESGFVPMHPGYAGIEAGAQAEAGAALSRTGLQLYGAVTDLQRRELEAQRQIKAMEMERIGGEEFGRLADSYKTRNDYEKWDEDYARSMAEIRQKLAKVAGEDEKLGLVMENYLNDQGRNFAKILRDKKFQVMSDRATAEFLYTSNQALSEYQAEFDENKKNLIKARIATSAGNLVRAGLMWEHEAVRHVLEFDQKAKALDAKQIETLADTSLNEHFPGDYDAQIKALEDPKEYRKMNLTVEQANNLANIVKARRSQHQEKQTVIQNETGKKFAQLLRDDALSFEMVDEAMAMGNMTLAQGNAWKKAIEDKYKPEGEGKIKTDPTVYANLFSLAHTSTDREAVKKEVLKNVDKLEQSDIEKLLAKAEATYEAAEGKRIQRGVEFIRNTVIPKRGMMEKFVSTPEEERDLKDALDAFDDAITKMKASGKTIAPEDIDRAARTASEAHSKTLYERMQGMTEYMRNQLKPAAIPKKPKAGEVPKRKPGESIEKYLKRTGQE